MLPHFLKPKQKSGDPIYKSLAEANFFQNEQLIEILTEQLYKIEGNKMYFHLNRLENKEIVPLKKIVEIMESNESLMVSVCFYDKEEGGEVIYKIDLYRFKFVKLLNILDYDWNEDNEIKDLVVEFIYEEEFIST